MESYTCTGYRGYYTLGCELRGITVCSLWGGVPWGGRVLGLMGRGLLGFEVWVRLRLCGWCWSCSILCRPCVSLVCALSGVASGYVRRLLSVPACALWLACRSCVEGVLSSCVAWL